MTVYVYVLILIGLLKLIQRYFRPGGLYRNQILTVLVGVTIPLVGAGLTVAGIEFSIHRDTTPVTFAMGNLVVAWGLFHYRLFEIVPIARDLVFISMRDSVIVLDGENRVVDINPAALAGLNQDFSTIVGKTVEQVYANFPKLVERYRDMTDFHEVIALEVNGESSYYDIRFTPILDRRGKITGRIIVGRNISEEVQAHHALFASEEKYRNLVESTTDWVWVIDTDGRHTFSNQAIKQLLGYEVEEIVGSSAFPLIHPEDQERTDQILKASIEEKCGWSDLSIRWQHKDGSIRFMESTAEPMLDSDGNLLGFSGIDRDVTERVRVEEERQQYAAQLETTNRKLEEANERLQQLSQVKDEFVANVSHELRTPITNLRLYLHVLTTRPDNRDETMDILERETDRLGSMIEGLLQLSRLDQDRVPIHLKGVDLNAIVEEYVLDRKLLAEEAGLTLILELENELPEVKADPQLIGQVLGIFLTNAINYTPPGGEVRIYTQERMQTKKRFVGFCVSDNGPGIPKEEQDQLFKRFFRGKAGLESEVSGTGLGLAIANEIVNEHNGLIEVESSGIAGEGTSFRVWLRV
jgi:PAS domain S-box-containing protein